MTTLNLKNLQNLRLRHKPQNSLWNSDGAQKRVFLTWRSLSGDFFHSKFLGLQKSSISESYQSLMTLKSRKTTIRLRIKPQNSKEEF